MAATRQELIVYAKGMRRKPTPAEKKLRKALREIYGPLEIYAQKIVGPFIADFVIPAKKLIIELDGTTHDTAEAMRYDARRDAMLRGFGFNIVRFPNKAVYDDVQAVVDTIQAIPDEDGWKYVRRNIKHWRDARNPDKQPNSPKKIEQRKRLKEAKAKRKAKKQLELNARILLAK